MAEDSFDWIGPVLGFVGLLAGSLFFSGQGQQNNNNNLPPPPPPPLGAKPSKGCGCTSKK